MMTSTKELKNVTKSLKTVKNTLFEMLGPQSDGFEESKLNLLLGMDSCGNLNAERDRFKKIQSNAEIQGEDSSTADCNLSAKEISRKFEETKKSQNFVNVEDSSVTQMKQKKFADDNSIDFNLKINPNNTLPKSAFRAIKDKNTTQMFSNTTNAFFPRQNEKGINNCFSTKFGNSLGQVENLNRHVRKPNSHDTNSNVYSLNLTTNNYNHTNSNNYQNNNFHNNSSNKQILFTSIKNNCRREKKLANQVNFQIIKTNQNYENTLPSNNINASSNVIEKNILQSNCKSWSINEKNGNTATAFNNSTTIGSLSTNFNSNVSVNVSGQSAFKRNINENVPKSSSRENLALTETKNSILHEEKNEKSFSNLQKNNNDVSTTPKFHNLPTNLLKENSYLKFLIIAADSIMEKGLHFLKEIEIVEKESSTTGLNCDTRHQNNQDLDISIDNSKVKFDSSDNNDYYSNESVITFSKISSFNKINLDPDSESLRRCDNKVCGVIDSKKLGWCKVKINKSKNSWLCRACFKAWKNNQFCYYCYVIYRDNTNASNYNDNKSWVQCDYCEMWQHIQCEEAKGYYPDLSELITDSDFKYMCPLCRCKHESVNCDPSNKIGEKTKNKTKNKKTYNGNSVNHDFIGYKTMNEKELDYNQSKNFLNNLVVYNVKRSKKKYENFPINEASNGIKDLLNTTNSNAFSNFSLFSSYDNRDIYHDLYRISAINEERKK